MRIVHSFWSKPGGAYHWPTIRYFLYSQALSVLQAKKVYGNIHLVTDSLGKDTFTKLQFPYDSIEVVLDDATVNRNWWIYGKIITYKMQSEPYYHIDGDVFLWDKLPQSVDSVPLIAQSFERPDNMDFDFVYTKNRIELEQTIKTLPDFWKHTADQIAVNAGVFGGTAYQFLRQYATAVEKLLIENASGNGWANVCLEQQLAYCAAKEAGLKFTALVDHLPADQQCYTHVAGSKKDKEFLSRLSTRLERDYPLHFKLINEQYAENATQLSKPARERSGTRGGDCGCGRNAATVAATPPAVPMLPRPYRRIGNSLILNP